MRPKNLINAFNITVKEKTIEIRQKRQFKTHSLCQAENR